MAVATLSTALLVPQVFNPYVFLRTQEKSKLIQSGAVARSGFLDNFLSGGGNIVTMPFYKDLVRNVSNVSSSDDTATSTPNAITGASIVQQRLSRNQSWTAADLAADLTGADPLKGIGDRVASYWAWDLQKTFLATLAGVFADNDAAASGSDTHTQYDLTYDASTNTGLPSGTPQSASDTTRFSAELLIDTLATMGDSADGLRTLLVHPVVYARMLKRNMITFVPDSQEKRNIPTFMDMEVVSDNMMPAGVSGTGLAGKYYTYILGSGALQLGMGSPRIPSEVFRAPNGGNGGGIETLYSRQEFVVAPEGTSYIGTATEGGASNTALATAANWSRRYPERKQVNIARLITQES
jgi:hypothetical protein